MLQGVGTLFEFRPVETTNDSKFTFLFVGRNIDVVKLESEIN